MKRIDKKTRNSIAKIDFTSICKQRNLPLLTLDERFISLFSNNEESSKLREIRENINALLKKQGHVVEEIKAYKRYKEQLMREIVENMEVDDSYLGRLKEKKLVKNQKLLLDAKEKLMFNEELLADLPYNIKEANEQLVEETTKVCYGIFQQNNEDLAEIEQEIADIRKRMDILQKQKAEKEGKNQQMYTYLHDLLGPEFMELLDDEWGNKSDIK